MYIQKKSYNRRISGPDRARVYSNGCDVFFYNRANPGAGRAYIQKGCNVFMFIRGEVRCVREEEKKFPAVKYLSIYLSKCPSIYLSI